MSWRSTDMRRCAASLPSSGVLLVESVGAAHHGDRLNAVDREIKGLVGQTQAIDVGVSGRLVRYGEVARFWEFHGVESIPASVGRRFKQECLIVGALDLAIDGPLVLPVQAVMRAAVAIRAMPCIIFIIDMECVFCFSKCYFLQI